MLAQGIFAHICCRLLRRNLGSQAVKPFFYQDILQLDKPPYAETPFRKLTGDFVSLKKIDDKEILKIDSKALILLSQQAMIDVAHLLRPAHLQSLSNILRDPEASNNDKFVALELLKNANVAAGMVLPGCQDTGTAICMAKKGQFVWTDGNDAEAISQGIYNTYTSSYLRYSQVAALDMFTEKNTGTNLPAQIEIYSTGGNEYSFLFIAKGGGSANKTFLYQQTKALLNPTSLYSFVNEKIKKVGIGAQFGGKYFCHDVRVIRLPRHGASCPVGIGVSCSADRQILGRITNDGVFLEQLETDPSQYLPDPSLNQLPTDVVKVNLNLPMKEILAELSKYPIKTRLSLTGTLVVARDIAHAKIKRQVSFTLNSLPFVFMPTKERLDSGQPMPDYFCNHPVYYAGPAKTPMNYASGSFGPTTAGRMDSYVGQFQQAGGSLIMLAKGNRSKAVTNACRKHGGFYLGSIGGPAAILAQNCIKKVEVLEYPELGMEAIWRVEVEDFPAFIVVDDKGNDFFKEWQVE
ncbi:Fumarate hydratase class I, aerobic [Schistosoma japonicum]|nr:Fumarate hydratase class I, aerobic [Schistosoma japonicum]KAH8853950.1 Fumarate hydratase class I, aerobic [Schistosoma japonicum]